MNNKKKKDSGAPPSFYEKDIERWTSEKFKNALIERQLDKANMAKAHADLDNLTTKNTNVLAMAGD